MTARHIGTGFNHTCAVLTDGSTRCWGRNDYGQLGDASTTHRNRGVEVFNLTGGQVCNAATGTPGTETCDGTDQNCNGVVDDLAPSTCTACTVPTGTCTAGSGQCAVSGSYVCGTSGAVRVDGSEISSCTVMADGRLRCWGYNGYYNLGDASVTQRMEPVDGFNGTLTAVTRFTGGFQTAIMRSIA